MKRGIGTVIAVILGLALTGPSIAAAQTAASRTPSAKAVDPGAQPHHRQASRRAAPYEPHYYARPVYYRPYPYGVPYPFVFGFGPWWW